MLGTVAVGIVLPQCNGVIDQCTETWTDATMTQVINQITAGMNWWNARMNNRVTFVFDIRRQVPTGYEPIDRSSYDDGLWIAETMSALGFGGPE